MIIRTILNPAEIRNLPAQDLSDEVCVVFDVLRATSSIVTACAHGARRVFPVLTIEEALALKTEMPDAVLGGERGGDRIEGFDVGNSPAEYCGFERRDIISTTTNGTVALRACEGASHVFAASFLNMKATVEAVRRLACVEDGRGVFERVCVVCAGTHADFSYEDALAAGRFVSCFDGASLDDASLAVRDVFLAHRDDYATTVRNCANGRALVAAGRDADITWCMREDVFDIVVGKVARGVFARVEGT